MVTVDFGCKFVCLCSGRYGAFLHIMHEADEGITENFDWNVGGEKPSARHSVGGRLRYSRSQRWLLWPRARSCKIGAKYKVPCTHFVQCFRTPNGRNEGSDCHHQTLRSVKIISRGQCWVSGDIRPAWATRTTRALSFVQLRAASSLPLRSPCTASKAKGSWPLRPLGPHFAIWSRACECKGTSAFHAEG